jgi:hypothetical protein
LAHRNGHDIIDFYVHTCVCTLCACPYCMHVRVHTFLDGFFPNLVEHSTGHRELHGLLYFYVRACVRALGACVHVTHARVCTLLNIFSPKLVETFLGSQKRARHNYLLRAFACARYARGCTHMRACVRSHIFGSIRSQVCENITLHVLHAF